MKTIYGNEEKDRLTSLLTEAQQKSLGYLLSEMRVIVLNASLWHSLPPWSVGERVIFDNLVLIVADGVLSVTVNGETRLAEAGDCIFIPETTPHSYKLAEGCTASSQFILHVLPLSPISANPFGILDSYFQKLKYPEAIFAMFRRAVAIRNHIEPLALSYAGTILQQILMEAIEDGHCQTGEHTPGASRLAAAYEFFAQNYTANISIVDVAAAVNLKESQFRRIFKQETGFTPNAYLHRLRLLNSVRVLMRRKYTLQEVAEKSGFNSVTYFCTSFLHFFKMTPDNFRRKWNS